MTSSISYLLKTLDYYFLLVLTDEWLNISAAVRPSSTLSPSHQHVTLHVRSRARRRVMCESWLVHVCRRLLDSLLRMIKSPRSGYSKLAEVKSSAIKKLFLLCLAFFFLKGNDFPVYTIICIYFHSVGESFAFMQKDDVCCIYWSVIQNNKQEPLVWNMSCSALDFWCKHELCLFVSSFSVSPLVSSLSRSPSSPGTLSSQNSSRTTKRKI